MQWFSRQFYPFEIFVIESTQQLNYLIDDNENIH